MKKSDLIGFLVVLLMCAFLVALSISTKKRSCRQCYHQGYMDAVNHFKKYIDSVSIEKSVILQFPAGFYKDSIDVHYPFTN